MNEFISGIDLSVFFQKSEEFWIVAITLLIACLFGAHQGVQSAAFGIVGNYFYWICRFIIEAALFIAVLFAVEKYLSHLLSSWSSFIVAVLLSLIPFTLSITAVDIIMGLPELGINVSSDLPTSRGVEFGLELIYQIDNHFLFSALLLLPRILMRSDVETASNVSLGNEALVETSDSLPFNQASYVETFLDSIEPPLEGHLCSMEAQEHYILVTTTNESRMVLHRFSDAVKQTPAALGMQVHRSHWVAHSAVEEIVLEGQNMKLKLTEGNTIPVSRTFRSAAESKYSKA